MRWSLLWIRGIHCLRQIRALQVIAPLIATASGPLGTNAQYLFSLEQELSRLGMQDDCLSELIVTVKRLLGEVLPEGVMRRGFA